MRIAQFFALLAVLSSCSKEAPQPDSPLNNAAEVSKAPPSAPDAGRLEETIDAEGDEPGSTKAPSLAVLNPQFRFDGAPGEVPEAIHVQFAEAVVERRHRKAGKSLLDIKPEVPGKLRFINPYTLEFRFDNAPPLQKKIKVSLRALDSRWGLLEGGDSAPNAELTTPGLSFLSSRIEWSHKQARLFIKTSAAVKTDDLQSKLRISGDGIELNGWKLIGAKGHSMAIELPRLAGLAGALSIEIAEGVRAAEGNFTAAAYAQIHTRFSGKTLLIERAAALASAGGFGIDVVCHDAESGKRSWFWHREMSRSFRVGPRCEPVAGSENKISIEPAVPFRLAPGQGGFRLLGDFKRGSYRLRLAAGMRSMDGSVLLQDYDVLIKVPARPALLQFVETGRYLPRKGWKSLRFSHRNVGAIMLEVRQVRPDNLAHWLAQNNEKAGRAVGDLVVRRALRVAGEADKISTGFLNVAELIGEQFAGVLEVTLSAPGLASHSRLLVSDINLLAKKQLKTPAKDKRSAEYGFSVWALDMHSQIGLSGVKLDLIAPSGRVISSCQSAGDGGCELLGPKADDLDQSEPLAIIARRGEDLTYLRFSDLQIPLNQTKVGGAPYRESKPYRAFLYGDRDLYRPGEPVHVVGLLRSAADQAPKSAMPVQMEVLDARRRRIVKRVLKTDDAGLVSLDFQLSEIAATGRYTINLSVADKKLSTRSIRVEEFMPERMRAEVTMQRKVYTSEQGLSATISAKYLFGGSAKGSPVRVDCRFSAVAPEHDGFSEFSFAPWADGKGGASGSDHRAAAKLDVSGRTEHACKRLTTAGFQPLKLRLEASVLEAGSGRSTRAWAEAVVLPDNFQIGVRSRDEKLQLGQPARFEVVVLGPDGKEMKLQEKLVLTLFRVDEKYAWGFNAAEDRWTYDHRIRLVEEKSLEHAAGKSRYEVNFEVSSDAPRFLIRAQAGKARAGKIVQGVGRRYWWSDNERNADHTPKAERPVEISLSAPKRVKIGEKSEVSFTAPFRGRALISVETDELRSSTWVDLQAGPQTLPFSVERFAPNVYVSLLLFKDPHLESETAFVPGRAFGLVSVAVDPQDKRQTIAIELPSEVRPLSELPVSIDLGEGEPGRRVTIAAVDEGILSLTGFKTPDPIAALYAKRSLGVRSYETVGWNLMLPGSNPASSKGGGAGGNMRGGSRVQPTRPVALWSGVLEVPIHGKLTHIFNVPRYRGSLRVMVVAVGSKRIGSEAKQIPVRDPLVLLATLPKQLAQGDRFFIPVSLTNLSGKAQQITVTASASSIDMGGTASKSKASLEFIGGSTRKLSLGDGEPGQVRFEARAMRAIGAATLRVEARAGKLVSAEELQVPFSPQAPRSRVAKIVELQSGDNDLSEHFKGWVPTTERSSVWISSNPYADSFNHLEHLIRYPYGCIEQTVSSARPLLFAGMMVPAVAPSAGEGKDVKAMLKAGLERVYSMQTPSGGFSYWPGSTQPNPWGSAYATHFLLDAQRLGQKVAPFRIDDAVNWLVGYADRLPKDRSKRHYKRSTAAYIHYVLARAGKGKKAQARSFLVSLGTKKEGWRNEARMLLQAALFLSGDRSFEAQLKKPDLGIIGNHKNNGWSFYSDLRGRALNLAVISELFPEHAGGEKLARLVAARLKRQSRYYSTQELAWAMTGLGLRVGKVGDLGQVSLSLGGPKLKVSAAGPAGPSWDILRAGERGKLVVNLQGGSGKRFAIIGSDGIRQDAKWSAGDSGLAVRRTVTRIDGSAIDLNLDSIELGEMLNIQLTLANLSGNDQENIALVDRLPAGFEIEAASSMRQPNRSGKDRWRVAHRNSRDDRIELFGRLKRAKTVRYSYRVRAVSAGEFRQPPVEAEAMYDPDLNSRKLGGSVKIIGPWALDRD